MATYQLKPGFWCEADPDKAQQYGERIELLTRMNGAKPVTPDLVVEDARHPDSPLHDAFEWDDGVAAEKYRLWQARVLLNRLQVVVENEEPHEVRGFFNVTDSKGFRGYVPYQSLMENESYHQQVVADALRQVKLWSRKYKEYQELNRIHRAVQETEAELLVVA